MDRAKLQQLSAWMGFVGIIIIIGGVLTAIAEVFAGLAFYQYQGF